MRDLTWMGSSLEDLSAFPADVKRSFGFQLREVQKGVTPGVAKPLNLHAFKKKSKSGIAMPREDIALIEQRLKRAREIDRAKE